jgi:type I restriction enzyme R subunit
MGYELSRVPPPPSNFAFLHPEWPEVHESATRAEAAVHADPRTACFYARRALELAVHWLYKNDATLKLPYQDHLSALIHEPTFRRAAGEAVFAKAKIIKELGNIAAHHARALATFDAHAAVRELFHVAFWLARTYARGTRPADALRYNPALLPQGGTGVSPVSARAHGPEAPATPEQLQQLETKLRERDEKLATLLATNATLDAALAQARAEVAAAKAANAATPDAHDYSEAETRDTFIDLLLREAGWPLDQPRDREYEVSGMPNSAGKGYVDYVLWGDDGRPLALVEAKKTRRDARVGQRQAELYADCLEKQFGRRPVIFYTNGYEHWLWDDASYPPRAIQGFYTRDELELLIQRRTSRLSPASVPVNEAIVERYYQTRAIRRIADTFETDRQRKALVVMATGAGKTRTVIALCDLLQRCNWAKRVLFLADRVALVNQAVNAFKKHLPDASPVNLVTEKDATGRVYVATYPTMLGLIDEAKADGRRRFGIGHFDLVIIDEAHRSVYQKYRAIFSYFDSLLVGLTATPRDEIDRDTYGLFDLERGVPTDAYDLEDAVKDGFLVPMQAVSVPLKFQRQGIRYDDLSDEEKEQWDALEWGEENEVPDEVSAEAVNKWLFNQDTVDKVLAHVMTRGVKVAGGDRLGKTIVFAKNHAHAAFVAGRFDANYPHLKGQFARVIDFQTEYAQSLIDDFSNPAKSPHLAISVDMLDTGIDVPEVVNLVFFKLVRSKTKFWQMIGRGTRLCPNLFGPGKDKEFFQVFDFCQNLEFFSQNPGTVEGSLGESLSKRLFKARLEMIAALEADPAAKNAKDDGRVAEDPVRETDLTAATKALLQTEVAAMNVNNFIVRPHRRLVETYKESKAWDRLTPEGRRELAEHVAGLPTELEREEEEAKRFDLLILHLQLAVLRAEPGFEQLRDQVMRIAGLLEEKSTIPSIRAQLVLIQELQLSEWWQNVTPAMLETVRRKLRDLVKLIDKVARKPLYTDFDDEMGPETTVAIPGFAAPDGFERFRAKARQFLLQHENHLSIQKVRLNEPLTAGDLAEIERMLLESGVGSPEQIAQAKAEAAGFGLFIRSLVGLHREAAKRVLGVFLARASLSANQIEFLNLIVEHLTRHGAMSPTLLYEPPFTDRAPQGPEALFPAADVEQLVAAIDETTARAAG